MNTGKLKTLLGEVSSQSVTARLIRALLETETTDTEYWRARAMRAEAELTKIKEIVLKNNKQGVVS